MFNLIIFCMCMVTTKQTDANSDVLDYNFHWMRVTSGSVFTQIATQHQIKYIHLQYAGIICIVCIVLEYIEVGDCQVK